VNFRLRNPSTFNADHQVDNEGAHLNIGCESFPAFTSGHPSSAPKLIRVRTGLHYISLMHAPDPQNYVKSGSPAWTKISSPRFAGGLQVPPQCAALFTKLYGRAASAKDFTSL